MKELIDARSSASNIWMLEIPKGACYVAANRLCETESVLFSDLRCCLCRCVGVSLATPTNVDSTMSRFDRF